MSNVLLIINEEAHARELSRVADYLIKASGLRPVYFVEDRMKPLGVHSKLAATPVETLTSEYFSVIAKNYSTMEIRGFWRRRVNEIVAGVLPIFNILAKLFPSNISSRIRNVVLNITFERNRLLRHSNLCAAVLSERNYTAVVLSEENVDLDGSIWIESAHKRGIRCIIVPFTISNTLEFIESCIYSKSNQLRAMAGNRIIGYAFPKWLMHYQGQDFLRTSYARIAAFELLGLTPPNPWLLNSGFADAIAVESSAMHNYYRAAGLPDSQLVTTGALVDDVMADVIADAEGRRRELLEALALPLDRPVLLCAFPPDQNTFDRPGCEFSDFNDLVEFWGKTLGSVKGWNIVVAAHPKLRPGRLDALRKYGLALTDRDTAALVPICDLYIATASATIRWAISCAKPVINFDVYRYDYGDYSGVEAVALARTRCEFESLVQVLTGDPAERERMQNAQRRDSVAWGFRDGLSGRRLVALIRGEAFAAPLQTADA